MSRILYCPVCGTFLLNDSRCCDECGSKHQPKLSNHDKEYYMKKSVELYGDSSHKMEILVNEEASKNSCFNRSLYNKKQWKINQMHQRLNSPTELKPKEQNVPKCPTCGSTNIKKISSVSKAAHGLAFGLFSKTARSQFECLNCHYKW